jgi:SAM-dependent methyltransferase
MSVLNFIKEKKDANLDAPETTLAHRKIIMRKSFLKKIYVRWYQSIIDEMKDLPQGKRVEIGSGGGFLKDMDNSILTSDVLTYPHCDLTFSAEQMPFDDNSLSAICMIDVLHHIPNCAQFFSEAQRVLVPGGKIIMIEPANTAFSRFIFKNFHHEGFDTNATEWAFPSSGPLSGANGALPWMVFTRDYEQFSEQNKQLKKQYIKLHTPFAYLVSGGLSFKSMLPGFMFRPFVCFEWLLTPFIPWLAMFQTIVITKSK